MNIRREVAETLVDGTEVRVELHSADAGVEQTALLISLSIPPTGEIQFAAPSVEFSSPQLPASRTINIDEIRGSIVDENHATKFQTLKATDIMKGRLPAQETHGGNSMTYYGAVIQLPANELNEVTVKLPPINVRGSRTELEPIRFLRKRAPHLTAVCQ